MTEKKKPQPDPRDEAYKAIDYSPRLRSRGKKGEDGPPDPNVHNIGVILELDERWRGVIALDLFADRIVKLKAPPYPQGEAGPWRDVDDLFTMSWLTENKLMDPTKTDVCDAVTMVANRNSFHRVREYLDALVWDEQERLDLWLTHYLHAGQHMHEELRESANSYLRVVGMKWIVSAVARVFRPGCQADHVLILEGRQGLGKSSALRDLFTDPWFSDTATPMHSKDAMQGLAGKWCIEMSELDSFNKAEATLAKGFLSRRIDYYRDSYGRRSNDHARQCVFAGTTNQDEYFRDSTGNRRFWPVLVAEYLQAELLADRNQLWAEAVHLFRTGYQWHPSPAESAIIERHCAYREIMDPWVEIISKWLAEECNVAERRGEDDLNPITVARILQKCLKVDSSRMDERAMATRIGRCMKQLGLQKREVKGRAQRHRARFFYYDPNEPADETTPANYAAAKGGE